ncbi:MAG TPA: Ig-like domain-containing protein, partial [Candidatus Krumholzibacterium sp.]|nr:Ig-like domain-containing protein [Candidatus Krumholzibacterium sp.]
MIRIIAIFVFVAISVVTIPACDDTVEPDDIPPDVYITYPMNNSTVSEIALITCMALDNDGIDNVTLYVDGYSLYQDGSEPYELFWNTIGYETGTSHTIIVRASDKTGNKADSEPVVLVVDNSMSAPRPVTLRPVEYFDGTYHLSWTTSPDEDFYSYTVFEAFERDMVEKTIVISSTVVTDTTCVATGIGISDTRYYQVVVADTLGLETSGNIMMGSSNNTIAYYPLDGNAVDASGNGLDGVVRNCQATEDRNGSPASALFFDGTNDRVTFSDHPELSLTGHLTICFWMRPDGDTESTQTIINCQKWGESFDTNAPYSISIPAP